MANKPSNAFELIKNMSKSEKRYFKIFSERHVLNEENKYIHLFDVLETAKDDDDDAHSKILSKKGINTSYIKADKNYLYRLILRSLQGFHHNKTQTIFQVEQLLLIEILYEKGLYDLCLKEINRTMEIAKSVENFSLIIELLIWERRSKGYSKGLSEAYDSNAQIKHYHQLMANQIAYTDLYYDALKIRVQGFKARDVKRIEEFKQLLKNPLLQKESLALSLLAKLRYHLVYVNYYYIANNNNKELHHLNKILELMEDSGYYDVENPFDYIYSFNQKLNLQINDSEKEFQEALKKFRAFPDRVKIAKEKSELQVFYFSYIAELKRLTLQSDNSKALNIINAAEKKLQEYQSRIEPAIQINLYYLFAINCFYQGERKKALKYVNTILNNYKESDREDMYNFCHVFNIVIHYDLGNLDLIEYLYTSTYNHFKRKGKLYPTELAVLKTIQSAIKEPKALKRKEHFATLLNQLKDLKQQEFEATAQELFNYEEWCASHAS